MSLSVLNSSEIANVAGGCCDRRMGIALSATVGAIAGMVVGARAALYYVVIGGAWFVKGFFSEFNGNSDAARSEVQAATNNMIFIPTLLVLGGGVAGGVALGLAVSKCLR